MRRRTSDSGSPVMRSNVRAWRMIGITFAAALLCWGASIVMLRAVAQNATPVASDQAQTAESNEAEEVQRRSAAPKTADEEAPEFRDSADNNISLPIDI